MKILKVLLLMLAATGCLSYAAENVSISDQQDAAIRKIKQLRLKNTPAARYEIEKLQALIEKLEAERAVNNRYQAKLAHQHKKHIDKHYPRFRELDREIVQLQRTYLQEFKRQNRSNQEKQHSQKMIDVWQNLPGVSSPSKVYMTRLHKARIAAIEKEASEIGTDPYLQSLDQQIEALQKEQDDLGF